MFITHPTFSLFEPRIPDDEMNECQDETVEQQKPDESCGDNAIHVKDTIDEETSDHGDSSRNVSQTNTFIVGVNVWCT